ncbi:MAG: zinc-ribbon domain-containing protein [Paracoccaceae bacterium]
MRLICPNCDAEYEVDASVIPENGRDVQCSNCGHAWYQMPETAVAEAEAGAALFDPPPALTSAAPSEPEPVAPPEPLPVEEAPEPAPRPRAMGESVLAVLREEAERETAARRAEAPAAPLETQEELGLTAAAPAVAEHQPPFAAPAADRPLRRDLLPDIEEINSTLRPVGVDDGGPAIAAPIRRGSGFRTGFVLMLVLAALVVALYVLAPRLAEQIPAAAPALGRFVATVDALRLWLDGQMSTISGSLGGRPES